MKELSVLYEYWCFIKINSLLKKKYKLISTDVLKLNKDGVYVTLKKGKEASFKYLNPKTNEEFIVYYNEGRDSKTVSQKPDNILSICKDGTLKAYEFIFDAKYKIDTSSKYKEKYNTPGPKEEDINTMHRYRDAIIYDYKKDKLFHKNSLKPKNSKNLGKDEISNMDTYSSKYLKNENLKENVNLLKDEYLLKSEDLLKYEDSLKNEELLKNESLLNNNDFFGNHKNINNCIFGAFVLFPYDNEEEFKNHRFYKSIEEVNVGAFPFLPSTTGLMENFLDELINESSYSTFERSIDKIGKDTYLKDEYFNERNVLVGTLKDKEQYNINISNKFYHMPKKNINLVKNNIKYIALYKSKNFFGEDSGITCYGKVKEINVLKRNEITEIPKASDELYCRFEIEEWIELPHKIISNGFSLRRSMYTTFYLLNNADTLEELCIKNKEELRFWMELKRFAKDDVMAKVNKEAGNIEAFDIDGINVIVTDTAVKSIKGNMVVEVSKDEFRRRTVRSLRRLLGSL
nr:nuclease domain-containing protein [Clostridium neonatale]